MEGEFCGNGACRCCDDDFRVGSHRQGIALPESIVRICTIQLGKMRDSCVGVIA